MNKQMPPAQRGSSLVEIMVTLAIGLIISAGAVAMVLSNREAYKSTEALSRIQEATRVAFEIMSRDMRSAGINACNGGRRVVNLLDNPTTRWWSDWTGGIRGFDNTTVSLAAGFTSTTAPPRVTNTDVVEVTYGGTSALDVRIHNATGDAVDVSGVSVPAHGFVLEQPVTLEAGDIAVVCDFESTTIFQISGVDAAANTVLHEVVATADPGNCSSGLVFRSPIDCNHGDGFVKVFPPASQIMRLEAAAWYVGSNGRTASTNSPTSLYRVSVGNNGAGSAIATPEEIVEGVSDMQVRYMEGGQYRLATEVTDWSLVTGVEITLTIEAPEAGTSTAGSGARLTRSLTHVVNLRNRVS